MNHPPKLFLQFFHWYCHPRLVKPIEGDLMELYEERVLEFGKRKADRLFVRDVLLLFRKDIIKPASGTYRINYYGMLKHNLTIIFRSFKRYKHSFLINLLGLSAGLTSFLLIFLWVNDELSKDQFHAQKDQIYQVMRTVFVDSRESFTTTSNAVVLPPTLLELFPEVELAVPVAEEFSYAVLSSEDKKRKSEGLFAGEAYFELFSFNLIQGDKATVLKNRESIVISSHLADYFFDGANPIGKSLHLVDNTDGDIEYEADYLVTGVFDNSDLNASVQYDFLLSNTRFVEDKDQSLRSWDSNNPEVYIKLPKDINSTAFEEKLNAFYLNKMKEVYGGAQTNTKYRMHLQAYPTRYLHGRYENGELSGGRISYVYLFSVIGVLILLIACVNFINLSTAVAARRAKEIGVKKVFGTHRTVIMGQYLLEACVLVGNATLAALLLVWLLLPGFNRATGKSLVFQLDLQLLSIVLAIGLITSLLAGAYPAIFLSRLAPLNALQARIRSSIAEVSLRKGLIIFQFVVSMVMIFSVLTISRQMEYVQSKNLGYERDNIITIAKDDGLIENVTPFLTEVSTLPGVKNSTILEGDISRANNRCGGFKRPNQPYIQFDFSRVGYDYIETIGLKLKEGRSFSRDFANEDTKIILNETAIAEMGIQDPIGKIVDIRGDREIIGILEDFHYQSLHDPIGPMFLIYEPSDATTIALKLSAGKEVETIAALEGIYQKYNAGLPFQFKFLDDEYNRLYHTEQKVAVLSTWFAVIAILISCLGLFGLTAFFTQQRIKEIGIRKVLGSSRINIVLLLSSGTMKMLLIAIAISVPSAILLLGNWLDNFTYRIDLSSWFFVSGAILTVLISAITVGFETWKAASVNPVECIKDE